MELLLDEDKGSKRQNYLEWDEYFMALTLIKGQMYEKEPPKNAAIILNNAKVVISMAFDDEAPFKDGSHFEHHAEYKAAQKVLQGVVMYVTAFPCESCSEYIARKGISELVFYYPREKSEKSMRLFEESKVIVRQFVTNRKQVKLDFDAFS